MKQLRGFTYDEISIGQTASYSKLIGEQDIQMFSALSGDANPVHLDETFAATSMFGERIAHGMLTGAVVSAALAMELPGPGCLYLGQTLRFSCPVKIGDRITVQLEVIKKRDDKQFITMNCEVFNQDNELVASGESMVMASPEKLQIDRPPSPQFKLI